MKMYSESLELMITLSLPFSTDEEIRFRKFPEFKEPFCVKIKIETYPQFMFEHYLLGCCVWAMD